MEKKVQDKGVCCHEKWVKSVLALLLLVFSAASFSAEVQEYDRLLQYRKVPGSTGCAAVLPDGEFLYTIGYAGLKVYRISEPQNPDLHTSSLSSAESLRCRFLSFALLGSLIRAGDVFFVMVQIFATGTRKILDEFR